MNSHAAIQLPAGDRQILRELAARQMTDAQLPLMQERIRDWYRHNDLAGGRPMVHLELATFAAEVIPPRLRCTSERGRQIESQILANLLNFELFDDDRIVPPFFPLSWRSSFRLFGQDFAVTRATDAKGRNIGYHYIPVIHDLEAELPALPASEFSVDKEATMAEKAALEDLFGDILPVRLLTGGLYAVPTQMIVRLMGMEAMFMAMYDCPEALHALLRRITDDYVAYFRYLEQLGCLLPTNSYAGVCQGTWGYTRQLPGPDAAAFVQQNPPASVTLLESWGYLDSQETVGISPDMFAEFFFPYYQEIASLFGLVSYGCCEPVDPIWDRCISQLDRLRKVSVSPWCNEAFMGERLHSRPVIYQRKPSPLFLGVGRELDEAAFRAHIRQTMQAARGCHLEITMRDIYTLEGNEEKGRRAVAIIRELAQTDWHS